MPTKAGMTPNQKNAKANHCRQKTRHGREGGHPRLVFFAPGPNPRAVLVRVKATRSAGALRATLTRAPPVATQNQPGQRNALFRQTKKHS
jgi:hypothetical protein